jgi:uncharacterized protein YaiL (DUF2058 family)
MPFVIWREWYNEATVKQLTEFGTLPRNETEVDDFDITDGEVVARVIATKANEDDPESFREGGEITIVEPAAIAGDYEISVDYAPTFYASKTEM